MMKTPLFRELSDEALVDNYIALRKLAFNGAAVKSRKLGTTLRHLDIVIAVARKRGLVLPAAL